MTANSVRRRAVVIEANEVPVKIFQRLAQMNPSSNLARLLKESCIITTRASDVPEDFLYPSQSWASFNMGVPYEKHLVHWYNDPKLKEFPLYWRIAADHGRSVGLVNTLHAPPPDEYLQDDGIKFFIPDIFADSPLTKPLRYTRFQEFNQRQTAKMPPSPTTSSMYTQTRSTFRPTNSSLLPFP